MTYTRGFTVITYAVMIQQCCITVLPCRGAETQPISCLLYCKVNRHFHAQQQQHMQALPFWPSKIRKIISKLSIQLSHISGMAYKISGKSTACSTTCSSLQQVKYERSLLALCEGNHQSGQWRGKCFHVMMSSWAANDERTPMECSHNGTKHWIEVDIVYSSKTYTHYTGTVLGYNG